MEFLKRAILRIASTPDARLSELPRLHRRLLLPILSPPPPLSPLPSSAAAAASYSPPTGTNL
ncbi:hypothetical protein ACMD2_23798 [Ananas comosus]|uniref:Uncharacterized protein n=1 Tax=Ananas comosus TaxID=4615 RepID=A0A199VHZ8_ANACO|nr:hypothetical protein ACMD2_23798 [Ananas comosus]